MTWHIGNLAAFDTESTGTDVENDRIVSATVAHIAPGQEPRVFSHLIAVDIDIPEAATEVHGITTEHARANGETAERVLNAVAAELATERERAARDAADVAYRYADRQAKALESELRAWQSVGASVRSMYGVAGR